MNLKKPAVFYLCSIGLALLVWPVAVLPQSSPTSSLAQQPALRDEALSQEIQHLFEDDQALLADMDSAKKDPAFRSTYKVFVARVRKEQNNPNFYDPAVYRLWAEEPAAPDLVRRYARFRTATNTHLEAIVATHGWPQRQAVGDQAAAQFFFLFGHADDNNVWRQTQRDTLRRVFLEDHVNPRMYAHLVDRITSLAGNPQMYGSIMGPGDDPGTAKLYWPVAGSLVTADGQRQQIGLPSIETDLEKFRQGASIGPYMTPMLPGMSSSIADVYGKPR